jgi:ABC-type spermidine/putrescine transport system permease subunit I
MKFYKKIAMTLFIMFLTSLITPAVAISKKSQTQYIFEATWTSSSNYWMYMLSSMAITSSSTNIGILVGFKNRHFLHRKNSNKKR